MKDANEIMGELDVEEKKVENIDLDKPIARINIGDFAHKDMFINEKVITINGIGVSMFGKTQLAFIYNSQNYKIDVGAKGINQLIDLFGDVPRKWIGKSVRCKAYSGKWMIDGSPVEGYELNFFSI